jgi:5-methylcytosine-specific restriction endonuclease McrA
MTPPPIIATLAWGGIVFSDIGDYVGYFKSERFADIQWLPRTISRRFEAVRFTRQKSTSSCWVCYSAATAQPAGALARKAAWIRCRKSRNWTPAREYQRRFRRTGSPRSTELLPAAEQDFLRRPERLKQYKKKKRMRLT